MDIYIYIWIYIWTHMYTYAYIWIHMDTYGGPRAGPWPKTGGGPKWARVPGPCRQFWARARPLGPHGPMLAHIWVGAVDLDV